MNKLIILPLLLGQTIFAQHYPGRFTIDGVINNTAAADKIILQFIKPDRSLYRDTSTLINGHFHLEGNITEAAVGKLSLEVKPEPGKKMLYDPENQYEILLEPGACKLSITGKMTDSKVTGSYNQGEYDNYYRAVRQLHLQMQPLNMSLPKAEQQFDINSYQRIKKELAALETKEQLLVEHYVNDNPASPVALFAVNKLDRVYKAPLPFKPYFQKLDTALKNTVAWKKMMQKIEDFSVFQPGDQMVDFSLPDTSGVQVTLSSFKGQYVFVDFWASWCGPCRMQSPFIRRAFEKFKNKPLRILSIAEDTDRDRWIKAIHDDGVELWTQLLDARGKPEAVAALYHISAIPQNFLADPNGKIIARNLSGLELEMKLNEILN